MIKFLYTNKITSAVVTASSTATGTTTANVQDPLPKKRWRATGKASEWLKFDMGSAQQITMFVLGGHNLTASATVNLYAHASDLGGTLATWVSTASYSTSMTVDSDGVAAAFIDQTYRYWLISIADTTNTATYVEAGIAWAGVSVSPDENVNENFAEVLADGSTVEWTEGGHQYSFRKPRWKQFHFEFRDLNFTNRDILETLWKSVYKTEPLIIAIDPTSYPARLTRYGKFTMDALDFNYAPYNRVSVSMDFRELR